MVQSYPVHGHIDGPIVMIGFGSIGRGTLPLIERHFSYDARAIYVIEPSDEHAVFLEQRGVKHIRLALTPENHREILRVIDFGQRANSAYLDWCRETKLYFEQKQKK